MRFIMTFVWCFLLIHMASYVVNSMTGGHYDFMTASTLSVIAIVIIFIIAEVIPRNPAASDNHH
ncbi:YjzD family protein [Metabacillus malikii]|uniref:DUF2929 family protein n=1 Tax=Metabacillus malikii TaxID=1504265 RepID=A0ABT9ZJ42_9BACI|nr:YjzD family protein [Metabacillus malikii]MDQ0232291.1 hypothetical protein [Metabacillus malikii]